MCLNGFVCVQDLDSELKDKYTIAEQLIDQKAGGVADAKKRAQSLQQEAKELLLKAGNKLQLLKGDITVISRLPTPDVKLKMSQRSTVRLLIDYIYMLWCSKTL